jgi:2-oxoglutarate/2-oxoacid ferredoxin oxidoreductase subunit beta
MATFKEFRNNVKPNWCPGCGDYSVQAAIQRAAANVGLEPENLAIISGIGCSGRISGYVNSYGVHGIHGRSLTLAQGLKMANRELTVIAAGGDGDGFAIGTAHTVHALRRNMDVTYIVMDNQIYGLTKGQTSPRSAVGFVTKSTPKGAIESPISPMQLALSVGATFVAQTMSSDLKGMTELIEKGINHKGFSFINVFSPCVTFNKVNTYDWYKEKVKSLSEIEDYDPTDKIQAMRVLMEYNDLVNGLVYVDNSKQAYQDQIPGFKQEALNKQTLNMEKDKFEKLCEEFM